MSSTACDRLREIGLAAGEPPTARGYTPSVFGEIPSLCERCGTADSGGSITALYTVLVEGDDFNEPISDMVRGTLDGHIMMSRDLAHEGHFPAIDVLQSVSRLATDLVSKDDQKLMSEVVELLAVYEKNRQMVDMGAYRAGSNPAVDRAAGVSGTAQCIAAVDPGIHFASGSDVTHAQCLGRRCAMSRNGKFQYELEPVLLTRQWDLDALLLDLGRINESLAGLRRELGAVQDEIDTTANEWKKQSQASAGLNVSGFAVVTRYMNELVQRRSAKEQAIAEREEERDQLIDRVVAAQRGVEAVEPHRDEMKAEFIKLRLSEEFKFADDHWSTLQAREDA